MWNLLGITLQPFGYASHLAVLSYTQRDLIVRSFHYVHAMKCYTNVTHEITERILREFRVRGIYKVWLWRSRNDFTASLTSLCAYSLLRGVTFEVLLLSSYALTPKTLTLSETFLELLLWNSFQCRCHFFRCHQCSEIFYPLRHTLFLETARSPSEQNQGHRVDVPFQ
jgi:hypothetical protein